MPRIADQARAADEARAMAKKYQGLTKMANRPGSSRFSLMVEWWLRRAAELDGSKMNSDT